MTRGIGRRRVQQTRVRVRGRCRGQRGMHDSEASNSRASYAQLLRGRGPNHGADIPDNPALRPVVEISGNRNLEQTDRCVGKKFKIAVKNYLGLNQGFGVVIHVGGTVPTTRHEKNLKAELGREPLYMVTYDRTHKRKGSNNYCDLRSKSVVGKYIATILQKYEDQSTQPRIDVEVWSNAGGGPTKGRVLGRSTRDRASSILGHAHPPPDVVLEHLARRDNQVSGHRFSMSS